MSRVRVLALALAGTALAGAALPPARAQDPQFFGELVLFGQGRSGSSSDLAMDWYLEQQALWANGAGFRLALETHDAQDSRHTEVQEAIGRLRLGGQQVEVGRMRLPFGIHSWSDLYYHPIITLPVSRTAHTEVNFALPLIDQGVSVSGGRPAFSYQVSWLTGDLESARLRDLAVRLQTYREPWVWGVNAYWGHIGDDPGEVYDTGMPGLAPTFECGCYPFTWGIERAVGVDWRYSVPYWQVRGEALIMDRGLDRTAWGFHVDVLHHSPTHYRQTYAIRVETFDHNTDLANNSTTAVTGAIRYLLGREATLDLNYSHDLAEGRDEVRGRLTWRRAF